LRWTPVPAARSVLTAPAILPCTCHATCFSACRCCAPRCTPAFPAGRQVCSRRGTVTALLVRRRLFYGFWTPRLRRCTTTVPGGLRAFPQPVLPDGATLPSHAACARRPRGHSLAYTGRSPVPTVDRHLQFCAVGSLSLPWDWWDIVIFADCGLRAQEQADGCTADTAVVTQMQTPPSSAWPVQRALRCSSLRLQAADYHHTTHHATAAPLLFLYYPHSLNYTPHTHTVRVIPAFTGTGGAGRTVPQSIQPCYTTPSLHLYHWTHT